MHEETTVLAAFAALAQKTRLAAFRLLMEAGPEGLPAGEIARRLHVPQNTLSSHLAALARGRLVRATRKGRHVYYAVDFDGVRAMMLFLVRDCCRGRPERCEELVHLVMPACANTESGA